MVPLDGSQFLYYVSSGYFILEDEKDTFDSLGAREELPLHHRFILAMAKS